MDDFNIHHRHRAHRCVGYVERWQQQVCVHHVGHLLLVSQVSIIAHTNRVANQTDKGPPIVLSEILHAAGQRSS